MVSDEGHLMFINVQLMYGLQLHVFIFDGACVVYSFQAIIGRTRLEKDSFSCIVIRPIFVSVDSLARKITNG